MTQQKFLVTLFQYSSLDDAPETEHLGIYDSKETAESIAQSYRDALVNGSDGLLLPRRSSIGDIELEVTPVNVNASPVLPVPIFIGFVESTPEVRQMLTYRGEKIFVIFVDPTTGHDALGSLRTDRAPSNEGILEVLSDTDKALTYEFPYSRVVKSQIEQRIARLAFSASRDTLERYLDEEGK